MFNCCSFADVALVDIAKLTLIAEETPKTNDQFWSNELADGFQVGFFGQNYTDFVDLFMALEIVK